MLASSRVVLVLMLPFALQAGAMMIDEFYFHRERGLPLWERIGHPLDTLTVILCYGLLLLWEPSRGSLLAFIGLALFSILFTTKDEPIHTRLCRREEHLTHLVLFALHPLVLGSAGLLWWQGTPLSRGLLEAQAVLASLFMIYQLVYWNLFAHKGFEHASGKRSDQ